MLQIKNIHKQYKTGDLIQNALDGVSLNLRDSEFVSILGPSGSGKTTLLNIIGGLDVVYEGEIIINRVSTQNYKDKDWDSYRAHTIGFVFQSYNLIPHQTVLSNVELALTISGISKSKRKDMALEALRKVGLYEHAHKKPNQLSGGQMQRVAIARALVNNPDIVLADEPTGALDSETSLQVMELLKEIAKDRLVVMVTHNPELAEQYSTRIVRLKDGKIESDTDPYNPENNGSEVEHRNLGHAGMSLLTSMHLSFKNLLSKRTRTLLVAAAGSIGIIGIALIMSLSNGANEYIQTVEEEALSEYPLTIGTATVDLTSMLTGEMEYSDSTADDVNEDGTGVSDANESGAGGNEGETNNESKSADGDVAETGTAVSRRDSEMVYEIPLISSMFGTVQENDLGSLKTYLESEESGIQQYVTAIEYSYSVEPYIYKIDEDGNARQVSPSTVTGASSLAAFASLFGSSSYGSAFSALPADESLYIDSYDVLAGHWPENETEIVAVIGSQNGITDLALYSLGLKDPTELDKMIEAYESANLSAAPEQSESGPWSFDDILGQEFRLIPSSSLYEYDESLGIYVNQSGSSKKLNELAAKSEKLTVCGIVRLKEGVSSTSITTTLCYSADLIPHLVEQAADSAVVKAQLKTPEINVLTGKGFDEETSDFDMASLFTIDEDALKDMFSFEDQDGTIDESAFEGLDISFGDYDLSDYIDFSSLIGSSTGNLIARLFDGVSIHITKEALTECFTALYDDFTTNYGDDPKTDLSALPGALKGYLQTDDAAQILKDTLKELIEEGEVALPKTEILTNTVATLLKGFINYANENGLTTAEDLETGLTAYLETAEAQEILDSIYDSFTDVIASYLTSEESVSRMLNNLLEGYTAYAGENNLPDPAAISEAFENYLSTSSASDILENSVQTMIDVDKLEENLNKITAEIGANISSALSGAMAQLTGQIQDAVTQMMTAYITSLFENLDFSADSLGSMFSMNMSAEGMMGMLTEMFSGTSSSLSSNLSDFGYTDLSKPDSMTIYPIDFECKNHVIEILDNYNAAMKAAGETGKVIAYSDVVGTLTSSVTTIIDIIGYVLISFVSISLVVSSIMIGVITYISVLERKKEIGILRAMGASKRNITQVFNCETIITGFLAGLIGIAMTFLILIPGNAILQSVTGQESLHAFLPIGSALLLILLSVALTTLGGLIPSKGAARQDPVIAMRSE